MYVYYIVRLVNGSTEYEGRVEVYHNGEWGTVCGHGWDLKDAQVACTESGNGDAVAVKYAAFYGRGSGQIWLTYVQCVGTELTITKCSHLGWGYKRCTHAGDVGVQCIPGC